MFETHTHIRICLRMCTANVQNYSCIQINIHAYTDKSLHIHKLASTHLYGMHAYNRYTHSLIHAYRCILNFITGQNEREETTQNTTVTKSAACASYKSNDVTYITATYTHAYTDSSANIPTRKCIQNYSCIQINIHAYTDKSLHTQKLVCTHLYMHFQSACMYVHVGIQNIHTYKASIEIYCS